MGVEMPPLILSSNGEKVSKSSIFKSVQNFIRKKDKCRKSSESSGIPSKSESEFESVKPFSNISVTTESVLNHTRNKLLEDEVINQPTCKKKKLGFFRRFSIKKSRKSFMKAKSFSAGNTNAHTSERSSVVDFTSFRARSVPGSCINIRNEVITTSQTLKEGNKSPTLCSDAFIPVNTSDASPPIRDNLAGQVSTTCNSLIDQRSTREEPLHALASSQSDSVNCTSDNLTLPSPENPTANIVPTEANSLLESSTTVVPMQSNWKPTRIRTNPNVTPTRNDCSYFHEHSKSTKNDLVDAVKINGSPKTAYTEECSSPSTTDGGYFSFDCSGDRINLNSTPELKSDMKFSSNPLFRRRNKSRMRSELKFDNLRLSDSLHGSRCSENDGSMLSNHSNCCSDTCEGYEALSRSANLVSQSYIADSTKQSSSNFSLNDSQKRSPRIKLGTRPLLSSPYYSPRISFISLNGTLSCAPVDNQRLNTSLITERNNNSTKMPSEVESDKVVDHHSSYETVKELTPDTIARVPVKNVSGEVDDSNAGEFIEEDKSSVDEEEENFYSIDNNISLVRYSSKDTVDESVGNASGLDVSYSTSSSRRTSLTFEMNEERGILEIEEDFSSVDGSSCSVEDFREIEASLLASEICAGSFFEENDGVDLSPENTDYQMTVVDCDEESTNLVENGEAKDCLEKYMSAPPREERSAPEGTSSPTPRPNESGKGVVRSSTGGEEVPPGYLSQAQVDSLLKRQEAQFEERMKRLSVSTDKKEAHLHAQMREEQKELEELRSAVAEVTQSREALLKMLEQYKGMLAAVVKDKSSVDKSLEGRVQEMEEEKRQALDDLANVENAFSDVHRKYERTKQVVETMKRNEEALRGKLDEYEGKIKRQESSLLTLQKHAEEKMMQASEEYDKLKQSTDQELTKMGALLKKAEMKIISLQEQLDRKSKDNQELTQLLDDLIAKMGPSK